MSSKTNDTPICYRKQSSAVNDETKRIKEWERTHDKVYDLNMQMCDIGKIRRNSMKMWIARDFGGELVLYDRKPYKKDNYWACDDKCDFMPMDDRLFPEVTFENSPQEVELVIKK